MRGPETRYPAIHGFCVPREFASSSANRSRPTRFGPLCATVKKGECKKFLIQVYRKPTVIQGAALEPQLLFERDIQSSATRDVTITQDLDLTGSRVDTTFWVVIKAGSNTSWTVAITKR